MDNTKDTPIDYKQFEGHTPGPWKVRNEREVTLTYLDGRYKKNGIEIDIQSDPSNQHVVTLKKIESLAHKGVSDANLIAAAPDLLKENQSLKLELQKQKELTGDWFNRWQKILGEIIPKGPMCRDCADGNGTCPNNNNLPCDPTEEVIERFKKQKELTAELVNGLKYARDLMKINVPSSQSKQYVEWIECRDIAESLIKKSSEIWPYKKTSLPGL